VISVTELKAKFSACLDEAERGGSITILKNGRPVGILGPVPSVETFARKTMAAKSRSSAKL
jgi:prevent-host-death family protein